MSRATDIRTYIVSKFPFYTIDELTRVVSMVSACHSAQTGIGKTDKTPEAIAPNGLWFDYQENKLVSVEGIQFTISSLNNFLEILRCMSGPMGLGERTFATLYLPVYSELKYACAGNEADMANLVCLIFSGLMKRYQNRARLGANNDYTFKYRFSTDPRPVSITIDKIKFTEDDRAEFRVHATTEVLSNALGGIHKVCLPTPKVGSERVALSLKQRYVTEQSADTYVSFIHGMYKCCKLDSNDCKKLGAIIYGWSYTEDQSFTVCYEDYFINVVRKLGEFSISVHRGSVTTIVGSHFKAVDFAETVKHNEMPDKFVSSDYLFRSLQLDDEGYLQFTLECTNSIVTGAHLFGGSGCFTVSDVDWEIRVRGTQDSRYYHAYAKLGTNRYTTLYPVQGSDITNKLAALRTMILLKGSIAKPTPGTPGFFKRMLSFFK